MDIFAVEDAMADWCAARIPELVRSSSPELYDHHFGDAALIDAVVRRSWISSGSLFCSEIAHLALDGDQILGLEMGYHAPELRARQHDMAGVWRLLREDGDIDDAGLTGVLDRTEQARWIHPEPRPRRYYIQLIATSPDHRDRGVEDALLDHAKRQALAMGYHRIEVDVPANHYMADFYAARGFQLLVESRIGAPSAHAVPPHRRLELILD